MRFACGRESVRDFTEKSVEGNVSAFAAAEAKLHSQRVQLLREEQGRTT